MSQPQPLFVDWRMPIFIVTTPVFLSPPFFHAIDTELTSVGISYAEYMNIEETAAWVRTLGYYKGWKQAEVYATNFREHDITGTLLQDLNHENLEDALGIRDPIHKDEFMSEIKSMLRKPSMSIINSDSEKLCTSGPTYFVHSAQSLSSECRRISFSANQSNKVVGLPSCGSCNGISEIFSSFSGGKSECASNIRTYFLTAVGEQSGCASVNSFSRCTTSGSDIGNTGETEWSDMKSASHTTLRSFQASPSESYFNSASPRRNAPSHLKKLKLSLEPGQIDSEGNVEFIRSWFIGIDPEVAVQRTRKAHTYIIAFKNANDAQRAFMKFEVNGFKIAKIYPPRPSPKRPIEYKALKRLLIRDGKSLRRDEVGYLEKGRRVFVNQIKGRRARLIKRKKDDQNWGWVSIYSKAGEELLTQVGEQCY